MKIFPLFVFVLLKLTVCQANYKNYRAYDVTPLTTDQIESLFEWQNEEDVDFWITGAPGRTSKVMIPPKLRNKFENFLTEKNITNKLIVEDVEKYLRTEKTMRNRKKRILSQPKLEQPDFSVFWALSEMETYCIQLAQKYPMLITREVIGKSGEGRDLFAMRVSSGSQFGQKPIIFIDSGTHAREWVGPASTLYLLHQLVENPASSQELLSKVDWIIIPNVNPDGYVYSFQVNRMWRQNRRRINETCVGVDLNRNYGFSWALAKRFSCGSLTYSGPAPFSEPESFAVHKYLERYRENVPLYLSVHSFGNMVLYPWGYTGSPGLAPNWQEHHQLGLRWANAIRNATGEKYIVGNVAKILGNAPGASDDHAFGYHDIPLVYTIELTGGGTTGFDFPEERIEHLVKETFLGFREFGLYIGDNFKLI